MESESRREREEWNENSDARMCDDDYYCLYFKSSELSVFFYIFLNFKRDSCMPHISRCENTKHSQTHYVV